MQKEEITRLFTAIAQRHSVRTFAPRPVESESLSQIIKFAENLSLPFETNARIAPFNAETGNKLYNNGINPPSNFAVFSQTDIISVSKAGFFGELLMLYAVSLGLSTCWFGHYKLSEVGKYFNEVSAPDRIKESAFGYGYGRNIDVGERIICCMPVGYRDETKKRFIDFVAGKLLSSRKPTEKLLEKPEIFESVPKDMIDVLESAKLAPSAANSQMWRFGFENDFRTIAVAKPVGYNHFKWEHPDADIGMCAAHIWLGLLEKGYAPEVCVKLDQDRAFWTFDINRKKN